jgi:hypothetical protein
MFVLSLKHHFIKFGGGGASCKYRYTYNPIWYSNMFATNQITDFYRDANLLLAL